MRTFPFLLLGAVGLLAGCAAATTDGADDSAGAIASAQAKVLEFRFDGEVVGASDVEARKAIVSQLMYVQGSLTTTQRGNAHVGNVTLTNVTETAAGDKKRITYSASLPVAWPKDVAAPSDYTLVLPKDATNFDAFNAKYDGKCGTNEYGQDSFWHDWNPKAGDGCSIDDADVVKSQATVRPHPKETKNKYPEYDLIWEDDRLEVVAVFGIVEGNTPSDWGYVSLQNFLEATKRQLTNPVVKDNEASASILKSQTLTGKMTVGGRERDVQVSGVVVSELQSVGSDFETWYDGVSENADMLMYNGHAGLGKNVNALARKGKVKANKYQFVLLNGCQTFAYIDTTFTDRRKEANGASDPDGTRFLDIVGNALPSYADGNAPGSSLFVQAALQADTPRSYSELLEQMPSAQVAVVFAEENNRFQP